MSQSTSPEPVPMLSPQSSNASTLYCKDCDTPLRARRAGFSPETPESSLNSPQHDVLEFHHGHGKHCHSLEHDVTSMSAEEKSPESGFDLGPHSPASIKSEADRPLEEDKSKAKSSSSFIDDEHIKSEDKSNDNDDDGDEQVITVRNAQNVYRPEACVFVANLPKHKADIEIERILRLRFGGFGNVFIKVRRDGTKLPIAFCQYTNVEDAERALSGGVEIKVFGRTCRVEKARCQRALFVTKTDGTFDAARDTASVRALLDARGRPLENIWPASSADLSLLGLPPGLWVQFQLYGDCQDAYKDLRDCLEYRFEFVRERSHRPRLFPDTDFHRNGQYKDQDQDRQPGSANGSAILVKNLPPMFEIPQICQMFASLGLVIGTQIVSSAKEHHNNMRTAVVQFYGPLDAGNAVSFANHYGIAAQDARSGLWYSLEIILMWPPAPRNSYSRPWMNGTRFPGPPAAAMPMLPMPNMGAAMPPAGYNGYEQFAAAQQPANVPGPDYNCPPFVPEAPWVNASQPTFMR